MASFQSTIRFFRASSRSTLRESMKSRFRTRIPKERMLMKIFGASARPLASKLKPGRPARIMNVNRWSGSSKSLSWKKSTSRRRHPHSLRQHGAIGNTTSSMATVMQHKDEDKASSNTPTPEVISPLSSRWLHELRSSPANWMTASRIAISPVLGYCIVNGYNKTAIVGIAIAAISDGLDGFVARRYDCQTQLGSILDPLADKVVINILSLSLWSNGTLPSYVVGIWFGKDVIMLAGGLAVYLRSQLASLQPTLVSKWNTALQFFTLSVALVDSTTSVTMAGEVLVYVLPWTCVTTGASLWSYRNVLFKLMDVPNEAKKD